MLGDPAANELYARLPVGYGGRFYGVYPATVMGIVDPVGQGRVEVQLPWSPDPEGGAGFQVWARLATLMGGVNRGSWFIPDVGDEVLVCFEGGDPRKPYVIGGLWNGVDTAPEVMDQDGLNNIKSITTRTGVKVTLNDQDGKQSLILQTPGGQSVTLQDGNAEGTVIIKDQNGNTVTLSGTGIAVQDAQSQATVTLSAGDMGVKAQTSIGLTQGEGVTNSMTFSAEGISITAAMAGEATMTCGLSSITLSSESLTIAIGPSSATLTPEGVTITSPAEISLQAPEISLTTSMLSVNAPFTEFAGPINCPLLIAESIVCDAYTPGAGNLL